MWEGHVLDIKYKLKIGALILLAGLCLPTWSLSAESSTAVSGELTGWSTFSSDGKNSPIVALRYIPHLAANGKLLDLVTWDLDLAAHLLVTYERLNNDFHGDSQAKLYRGWVRLSDEKNELRVGLQKLNFGPGKILRPLQWFDHMDPKDPTKFTLGVQGALLRRYFDNNANLWVWSLLGNRDPVGPVPLVTRSGKAEYGARLQLPLLTGEVGLSVHQRQIEWGKMVSDERRLGVDGVFDIGIGAWFEAMTTQLDSHPFLPKDVLIATVGGDYTLPIGNGLYLSIEAMVHRTNASAQQNPDERWLLALGPSYPISLWDQIRLVAVTSMQGEGGNYDLNWQRKYDNALLAAGLFFNELAPEAAVSRASLRAEVQKGIKLLIQYNH